MARLYEMIHSKGSRYNARFRHDVACITSTGAKGPGLWKHTATYFCFV